MHVFGYSDYQKGGKVTTYCITVYDEITAGVGLTHKGIVYSNSNTAAPPKLELIPKATYTICTETLRYLSPQELANAVWSDFLKTRRTDGIKLLSLTLL